MKKKYRVTLTLAERRELEEGIKRDHYQGRKLKRAQILLGANEGEGGKAMKDPELVLAFDVQMRMVERLRHRYVQQGLRTVLHGKERAGGYQRTFDSRVEAHVIALRCSEPPAGQNKWSLRLLADKMVELAYVEQISHESVRSILKKHPLSLGGSAPG